MEQTERKVNISQEISKNLMQDSKIFKSEIVKSNN